MNCVKQYYNDMQKLTSLTDVIQVRVDTVAKTLEFSIIYPFLMWGYTDVQLDGEFPPYSERPMNAAFTFQGVQTQIDNAFIIQQLHLLFMHANRCFGNYGFPNSPFLDAVTYENYGGKFLSNYFELQESSGTKEFFYNQFLMPATLIRKMWDSMDTADPLVENKVLSVVLDTMSKVYSNSDKKLWLAPGTYNLYYGNPPASSGQDQLLVTTLCA